MINYSATYQVSGGEGQPAMVSLQGDKMVISLKDEFGNSRDVYWAYDQIIREDFWKEGRALVRTAGYPTQAIEVRSKEFAEKLVLKLAQDRSFSGRVRNNKAAGLIKVVLFTVAILLAAYFWLMPYLAERLAKRVPVSYEESLGNSMFNAIKGSLRVDEKRSLYINEFYSELRIPTQYSVRITVVNDTIANAFAMPGGNIVVYSRLIDEMKNYEDLAALLTHEFTHVEKKHSTRALFRQLGSTIFLSIIVGDLGVIADILIRQADNLKSLDYSRRLEKEADLNGVRIMNERKIDCNGFVRLFGLLKQEMDGKTEEPAEWISSHPNLDKRIDYVKRNEWFNKNSPETNETLDTIFKKIISKDQKPAN